MAVSIRMHRYGRKKRPYFRMVAVDSRKRRDGPVLETLGLYNPLNDKEGFQVNEPLVLEFLRKGATPSSTSLDILKKTGLWEKFLAEKGKKIVES